MADENAGKTEKPKIIVDDDWKAEAQAEKQRLSEDAAKKPAAKAGDASGEAAQGGGGEEPRGIPPASFTSLVNTIAMQTMMALGGVEDPETKKRYVDLGVAKYHIDTLTMLTEKTKGNLTSEESSLLDRALYDLQTGFVQISQHVQSQSDRQQK
ncbi:MAG: DUF1844 domain-containing protein [Phycisphaerae bacterium]|nr:DUF1844 domain-containing protein [Phycisphaerae bacterium]